MTKQEILVEVQEIFRDVLDNEDIVLTEETTANDIEEWDSLTHIQLIVAEEKHFKIKFQSKEILAWKNVGEMLDSIQAKLQ
jgi:acyl carrier protein